LDKLVEPDAKSKALRNELTGMLIQARSRLFGVLLGGNRVSELEPLVASLRESLPTSEADAEENDGNSKDIRVLQTLFQIMLRDGRTEEARTMLKTFEERGSNGFAGIGESAVARFLGEGYRILGEANEAEKHIRAAAETAKDSEKAAAARRLAVFLAMRDAAGAKEAEQIFRRLLADNPEDYRSKMGLLQL